MDSDSDSSSTASDALLIIRPVPSAKPNHVRFQRCYDRRLLLALSKSDKVCSPQGLKPLSEWYGEYEPPAIHGGGAAGAGHGGNANGAGGGGRHTGGRDATSGRRERTIVQANERHNDRDSHPRTPGTPVTGAMGDFRIPGLRSTLANPADSGDSAFGGSRRRQQQQQSGRDGDIKDRDSFRDRDSESKERPWSVAGPGSGVGSGAAAGTAGALDRRRQLGGDFIKKDGRAAEEGGWRSSRETMPNRERLPRDRDRDRDRDVRDGNGRPGFGERERDRDNRDSRAGNDRRRQPAWMDDDEPLSKAGQANVPEYRRRGLNGTAASTPTADSTPAWMLDESPTASGGLESSLEALEAKNTSGSSASAGNKAEHVDSIQAWKAQMKELERKQKLQEQRELRREMGLPELDDKDLEAKVSDGKGAQAQTQPSKEAAAAAAPAKSVFADFLLPASSAKDKEHNKVEDKPRSSRFARMFAGPGTPDGTSHSGNQVQPAVSPQPALTQTTQSSGTEGHGSSSNNLLAALLPGMTSGTNIAATNSTSGAGKPPATQADSQSMARLMEMLHMSSTTPPAGASSKQPTAAPHAQHQAHPVTSGPLRQAQQPAAEKHLRPSQSAHDLAYHAQQISRSPVEMSAGQPRNSQQPHSQQQRDANYDQDTHTLQSQGQTPRQTQPMHMPPRDQMGLSPNQSRLANRSSSHGNVPATLQSFTQTQDAGYREQPSQAPPPNINLLQLLGGQVSPPPGPPLPPHMNKLPQPPNPLPQRQQQQQQGLGRPASPRHQGFPGVNGHGHDHQQAHMAASLQAQLGQAGGRGEMPPGYPGINPAQQGRPPSQGSYMQQQQQPLPPQQPSHARSPSNTMNPAYMMQQQHQQLQQRLAGMPPPLQQAFSPPPLSHLPGLGGPPGVGGPPFPPLPSGGIPPHLAQQNALAQLLASGGRPSGPQYGLSPPPPPGNNEFQRRAMPPPPGPSIEGTLGYWNDQRMPGPYSSAPGRGPPPGPGPQQPPHPGQAQMQIPQNQIDLMALLTGGARAGGR